MFYFFVNYVHGCWVYVPLIAKSSLYIIWGAPIIKLVGKTIPKKKKPQCENTNIHKHTYILQVLQVFRNMNINVIRLVCISAALLEQVELF